MSPHRRTAGDVRSTLKGHRGFPGTDEWQRWDEELVEDFGRWLNKVARLLGVLLFLVLAAIAIGWLKQLIF